MNEIAVRYTVPDIYALKVRALQEIAELEAIDSREFALKHIGGWAPWRIDFRFGNYDKFERRQEIYVDRYCWRYLVNFYALEKYMLCTEYDKLIKDIEEDRTPVFTVENAEGWLAGLKEMVYENVRMLCKRVYENLCTSTYRTGSGYNGVKKKRNNNGVDHFFILSTSDYRRVFSCYASTPTITDDLEKACYLLDGKLVPEVTIIEQARSLKKSEVANEYFSIKMCANGNTHYRLAQEMADRLNRICPDGTLIGEKMRIKIFEGRNA